MACRSSNIGLISMHIVYLQCIIVGKEEREWFFLIKNTNRFKIFRGKRENEKANEVY